VCPVVPGGPVGQGLVMVEHEGKIEKLEMGLEMGLSGFAGNGFLIHGSCSFDGWLIGSVFVNGEIGLLHIDFEEIFPSREMQGCGLRQEAGALLQKICDVLAGESLEVEGILHGPLDLIRSMDFAQGHDLLNVVPGVHSAFIELPVIVRGLW